MKDGSGMGGSLCGSRSWWEDLAKSKTRQIKKQKITGQNRAQQSDKLNTFSHFLRFPAEEVFSKFCKRRENGGVLGPSSCPNLAQECAFRALSVCLWAGF